MHEGAHLYAAKIIRIARRKSKPRGPTPREIKTLHSTFPKNILLDLGTRRNGVCIWGSSRSRSRPWHRYLLKSLAALIKMEASAIPREMFYGPVAVNRWCRAFIIFTIENGACSYPLASVQKSSHRGASVSDDAAAESCTVHSQFR